ncbi:MAG TPA: hypothetical protein VFT45_24760 [Longimicrobium sp.]|nr:hypothetical protein [Longimicrobium sp.]
MSAAARRRPARWRDAARGEMLALWDTRALHWACLIPFVGVGSDVPFDDVRTLAWLMFFLPLALQREGGRGRGNVALPMSGVALDLIRVAWGTACASLLLGLCIAVHAWLVTWETGSTLAGFPVWYPAALFLVGLAQYLFGAAIMLLAERPGRVMVAAFTLGFTLCSVTGVWLETAEYREEYSGDSIIHVASTSLTLASSLLGAGIAVLAVVASAALGRRGGWGRRHVGLLRWPARAPVARTRSGPALPGSPRIPASPASVVLRQLVLLAPRMGWLLLVAAAIAARRAGTELAADAGAPAFLGDQSYAFVNAAFFWPVLVWMDERGSREWDAVYPCGTVAHRVMHAAAGMAWFWALLLLVLAADVGGAMTAGSLDTLADVPARIWLGVPACALGLYCLGTPCAVLTDRPVLASLVYAMVLPVTLFIVEVVLRLGQGVDGAPLPLSPLRALAPTGWALPEDWSAAVVVLWMPIFMTAAWGAIWLRAWWERYGRSPSRREVARLIRGRRARVPTIS